MQSITKTCFVFFLLLCSHTAYTQYCTEDDRFTNTNYFSVSELDSLFDQNYGNAIDWEGVATDLEMDIYYPSDDVEDLAQRPFILLIHGGGFIGGNKSNWRNDCREFAKRGYVAATMSYRLGWNQLSITDQLRAVYRAQQDANAAMRYIVEQSEELKVDTNWMFIGGSSAGSITALNVAYADEDEWDGLVSDLNNHITESSAILQYILGDFNMDSNVTITDFNLYQPNASKIAVGTMTYD